VQVLGYLVATFYDKCPMSRWQNIVVFLFMLESSIEQQEQGHNYLKTGPLQNLPEKGNTGSDHWKVVEMT